MAATRLRRVGGRDDDLLHHVPLRLVRHGVRRHAIVAGGARNPDPSAGDVDDAVTNAATVASLLAAEKADKQKKLESFRRGTRRRVAARVAAERGDDARHTADIALAVIRTTNDERRTTLRRSNGNPRVEAPITPTPLARLLRSARDAARESHRSALATFVPAAFGGDRGPPGAVADDLADDIADDIAATRVPTTAVPPDVAESRRQRVKNARDAAAAAQRAAASRREPTRENRALSRGSAPKTVSAPETVDAVTVDAKETRKKPTAEDVAAWLALRGLTWDSVPRVCACPHARASAPFDAGAAFRCAANCPLYGDPDARDEATRAALRAL